MILIERSAHDGSKIVARIELLRNAGTRRRRSRCPGFRAKRRSIRATIMNRCC